VAFLLAADAIPELSCQGAAADGPALFREDIPVATDMSACPELGLSLAVPTEHSTY